MHDILSPGAVVVVEGVAVAVAVAAEELQNIQN
jgi:hypothetical protein